MGGLDTEITDATTTVALEIAWFEPTGISQSVIRLGLRSEASARFERGVDPYSIDTAIARFVELLGETCPDVRRSPRGDRRTRRVAAAGRTQHGGADAAGQPDPRHIARPPTDLPGLLDRIGYTVSGPATTPSRSRSRRGGRTRPRRST